MLGLDGHHLHALGGAGGLGGQRGGVDKQTALLVGDEGQLLVGGEEADVHQLPLVAVRAGEAAAVGGGGVGLQGHLGHLAVGEEEQHVAAVIAAEAHVDHVLPLVHIQLGGQIVPQHAGLGVGEIPHPGLVALLMVGKENHLGGGVGLEGLAQAVALLVLLLAGHPQGLGADFLEIALPAEENGDGAGLDDLFLLRLLHLVAEHHLGAAGHGVLLPHVGELVDDDAADALRLGEDVLQVGDLVLQRGGFGGAL